GVVAGSFALDECDSSGRLVGTSRGRRADPLSECCWRIYRVRHDGRGCPLSLHRVLVFFHPIVGSDTLRFRDRSLASLSGLARRTDQEEAAKGIGKAANCKTGGEDAVDSVAAGVSSLAACGLGGTSTHRHLEGECRGARSG